VLLFKKEIGTNNYINIRLLFTSNSNKTLGDLLLLLVKLVNFNSQRSTTRSSIQHSFIHFIRRVDKQQQQGLDKD